MDVLGVRVELPHTAPMLLLKESDGPRYLPIWLGATEAAAIASELDHERAPRPLTHDLFAATLGALDATVDAARITELADGTFYALLIVGEHEIDARPSDAIAVALRCGARVEVADEVLDEAGVELAQRDTAEADVEAFREFLDSVEPEDFES